MKYSFVLAALVASVAAQGTQDQVAQAKKCVESCKVTACKSDDQLCLCTNQDAFKTLSACAPTNSDCTPILQYLLDFKSNQCPKIIAGGSSSAAATGSATGSATATGSETAAATETTAAGEETAAPTGGASSNETTSTGGDSGSTGGSESSASSAATGTSTSTPTQAASGVGKLAVGSVAGVIAFVAVLLL